MRTIRKVNRTLFFLFVIAVNSVNCAQPSREEVKDQDGDFEQVVFTEEHAENKKDKVGLKDTALQQTSIKGKDSAIISLGEQRLIVTKKSDYDYQIIVYSNEKVVADTLIYTGFSPSHVFYNERFFVMDAGVGPSFFVVYDSKRKRFRSYKGHWATTMSFKIIDEKLYVGYYIFEGGGGFLSIIDLNTEEIKNIYKVDGEEITSSCVRAFEKNGEVYVLMGNHSNVQPVYAIEGDGLKKTKLEMEGAYENIKLSELFE